MEFSENNINVFNSFANALHLPKNNNFKALQTHHKKVYDYIISKYKNETTRRTYLSALAKLFRVAKGPESYLYKKYSKLSVQLQKKIELNNLSQTVSPQRIANYITLKEIIKRREELRKLFEQNPEDHKINQQYLLLCLYTMQPPLRMEYKHMEIVNALPSNKQQNYLVRKFDKFYTVINKDKVSNKYGQGVFELSAELSDVIITSLKHYPRKFILSLNTNPDLPIGKQSFEILLRGCFSNKRIGVDLLRSAYITYVYDKKNVTMKDKTELAKQMRSSVAMASTIYHKITQNEISEEDLIDEFVDRININDKDQLKMRVIEIINAIRKREED